jgi:hypothetical protein
VAWLSILRGLLHGTLDISKLVFPVSTEERMTPNDHIRVILVTGARKAIQIELTNEGAVVGMFEVLRQIFMGKGGLIVDVEGISVGGE